MANVVYKRPMRVYKRRTRLKRYLNDVRAAKDDEANGLSFNAVNTEAKLLRCKLKDGR